MIDGERELTAGLLSKEFSFRLIVSGHVGVKEIEMLIKKLQIDKEILADEAEADRVTGPDGPPDPKRKLFCGFSGLLQPVILGRLVGFDVIIETIWFWVEIQDPSNLSRLSFFQRIFA